MNDFFAGTRLGRAVARAEKVRAEIAETGMNLSETALKFALAHPAVSTVIAGIPSVQQAEANVRLGTLSVLKRGTKLVNFFQERC